MKDPIEVIAAICHEANRRYCKEIGDDSQKPWEESPWWQKQSALAGVGFVMKNPMAPPAKAHENWLKQKVEEGWVYGAVKDDDAKTHPNIRPYEELSDDQKLKDHIFKAIALTMLTFDPAASNPN
jgi:hypothetical protein